MPTQKTRINVSLSRTMEKALATLARRDRVPQATKAARLLETAIELEEDQVWDALARERNTKDARFVSHESAWS